jgi:hypothetical protein
VPDLLSRVRKILPRRWVTRVKRLLAGPGVRTRNLSPKKHPIRPGPSDAELKHIWIELRKTWFPDLIELDRFSVNWSKRRQKRTLASCQPKRTRVVVARELSGEENRGWLEPLLYHEMCHAALGESLRRERGRTPWHGREFKRLEQQHPQTKALQRWIKEGGWLHAIRSARAKQTAAGRRKRS